MAGGKNLLLGLQRLLVIVCVLSVLNARSLASQINPYSVLYFGCCMIAGSVYENSDWQHRSCSICIFSFCLSVSLSLSLSLCLARALSASLCHCCDLIQDPGKLCSSLHCSRCHMKDERNGSGWHLLHDSFSKLPGTRPCLSASNVNQSLQSLCANPDRLNLAGVPALVSNKA